MHGFKDKVAIVTGGGSGIGRAVCEALGAGGAVVTVADVDVASAERVAGDIRARGGHAEAAALDVCDAAQVARVIEETARKHARLDYMFNNAGIAIGGEELHVSLEDWNRVLDVDLRGVIHGVRAAYPLMVKQGHGHIVNTASLAGLVPAPLEISYSAAKYAVVGLSHALRAEGAALGVRVSVVCPGFIDTPILRNSALRGPGDHRAKLLALIPKPMPPEDCARIILDGVGKNRSTIIVTGHARALWWLNRLSPAGAIWVAKKVVERARKITREG